jgi:hypothetical protein
MWPMSVQKSHAFDFPNNQMVSKPTDTTLRVQLNEARWRSLLGPLSASVSIRLSHTEVRHVREIATRLFGPDSRVFIWEKQSAGADGSMITTVRILVECARLLQDRLSAESSLMERLQDRLGGRRTRVLLIDPSFTPTQEYKRFRFVAMEY